MLVNQPVVDERPEDGPPQPDDHIVHGPGEAEQLDNDRQVAEEEFFHGFEPAPAADPGALS